MKQYLLTREVDGPQRRFWVKDHCVVIEPKPWSQLVPATVIDAIQKDAPLLQQELRWEPVAESDDLADVKE